MKYPACMPNSGSFERRDIIALACILPAAVFLIFVNLDRSYLWQDEAQNALLARTTLKYGIPMGFDGPNSLSQELGHDIDANGVFRYHPWLPFYICAASFAVFGESTYSARFPYAVIGLATVALTYVVARMVWRSTAAAVFSTLVLTFSVPFLLLVRQCRYYSPLVFFVLLALYGYIETLRGRKRGPWVMGGAAVCIMHTLHLHALLFFASVLIHTALWRHPYWRRVVVPIVVVMAAHVPWFVWVLNVAEYRHAVSHEHAMMFLRELVRQCVDYAFFPPLLVAAGLLIVRRKPYYHPCFDPPQTAGIVVILCYTALTLFALGFRAPYPFFRYMAPVTAFAAILAGYVATATFAWNRLLGVALTGAVALWMLFPCALWKYPIELFEPYRGPIGGIVEFLREHAEDGDSIVITYGDMPVKFYTKLRVLGGAAADELPPPVPPKWVILRRFLNSHANVSDYIRELLESKQYETIVLDAADLPFENREQVDLHEWKTTNRIIGRVIVFRRHADP